jgi:hypothetical protein
MLLAKQLSEDFFAESRLPTPLKIPARFLESAAANGIGSHPTRLCTGIAVRGAVKENVSLNLWFAVAHADSTEI